MQPDVIFIHDASEVANTVTDDKPELHRAIAYSDYYYYYGDNSSVVDLYKVTGKPVMIEDFELTHVYNEL